MLALIGHLSEWQFNWLSNKDALSNGDNAEHFVIFVNQVGLETRPIAKLNNNRTEGLPTDGKEGRRGGKHFFLRRDVRAEVKARGSERGNVYSCTIP